MDLYYHPLSTYSQKVLMAFYEKEVPFTPKLINLQNPAEKAAYLKIHPLGKIPFLVLDDGWQIPESSIIIEYLDTHFSSGTSLIPEDKDLARQVRCRDRLIDLYLDDNISIITFASFKKPEQSNQESLQKAKARVMTMFELLDKELENKTWLMGDYLSMADCAAAPPLFYAQKATPFQQFANINAYWNRLCNRPSFQRVLNEVIPYLEKLQKK